MNLEIVDYSEKSIAVFGDTRPIKDELKALGGRFNPRLTYEGERRTGWIFPTSKRSDIEALCNTTIINNAPTKETRQVVQHDTPVEKPKPQIKKDCNHMDLHTAILNILKYQGADFLLDAKMINALVDFQAYEQHPALKNIFRTLHQDGYVAKVAKAQSWDSSCDQLVYEVERDYAMPHDLVEYTLKSVAFGLGKQSSITVPFGKGNAAPSKPKVNSQSTGKSWKKMTSEEREAHLNSLVEIRPSSCGLTFTSVYIADETDEYTKNLCFGINYEVSGKLPQDNWVNLSYAIYDKQNRLRSQSILTSTLSGKAKPYNIIDSCSVEVRMKAFDIGKILIYIAD